MYTPCVNCVDSMMTHSSVNSCFKSDQKGPALNMVLDEALQLQVPASHGKI